MNQPLDILVLSGSLRAASSNTAALQAVRALAPAGIAVTLYERLGELPYFNPDLDAEGAAPPAIVADLRARIGQADGVLICSPEYAHGVPGVLKNALDWLVSSLEFPGKPVALLNISPRSTYAQASLSETLATMSATLVADPALTLALPRNRLDAAGMLADPAVAQALRAALETFARAIMAQRAGDATRS